MVELAEILPRDERAPSLFVPSELYGAPNCLARSAFILPVFLLGEVFLQTCCACLVLHGNSTVFAVLAEHQPASRFADC